MASVTECLSQIQNLTRKNLEILQAINESYFTKQSHLQVNVGDAKYVIPSFMSVENRLSVIEENFNNLVNAPSTGEAYFHMDGNTRAIEVKPYTHVPNALVLNEIKEFSHNQNDIFKEALSEYHLYMEQTILNVDKVLIIATPEYKRRADNRERGVGYETSLITEV